MTKNTYKPQSHKTSHVRRHELSEADKLMDAELKAIEEAKIAARNEHFRQIYEATVNGQLPKEPYTNKDDIYAYIAGRARYEEIHNAPYKNAAAATALRWAAIPASIVPGLGAALNGAATGLIVHEAEKRNDPPKRIHELLVCGGIATGLSLLPVVGPTGAIASSAIGAGFSARDVVHDVRHGIEDKPVLCHDLIVEHVVDPLLGVQSQSTPAVKTLHNLTEKITR